MEIKVNIQSCDKCPFAKVEKVYTADSFENIRNITCTASGKMVHKYLDWNDKSPVPSDCPQKVGEPEPEVQKKWFNIHGSVEADVDDETFNDEFLKWVESKGWSFFGFTGPTPEEEEK